MADTNAKLEALGNQISGQIDKLADDESAGESPVGEVGGGREEQETPPPAPFPTPPVKEKQPAVAAKPAASPAAEPEEPVEQGPPSATGAKPAPTQAAPATTPAQPAAGDDILSGLDPQYVNMLRKFAPAGKITNDVELKVAQARAADDYWRIQKDKAEQARKEQEVPPQAPEEVPPPPELARYDAPIQEVIEEAKGVIANITGWKQERAKALSVASSLQSRRNRGDSTVDPDELVDSWAKVHEIDNNIAGWERQYRLARGKYDDLVTRRNEVQLLLDTRARLDLQAKGEADKEQDIATQTYFNEWKGHLTRLAEQYKVPANRLPKLEKVARAATYFAATGGEIEDTGAFLDEVVRDFMEDVQTAKQEGAQEFTKIKAADAPRVPPPARSTSDDTPLPPVTGPRSSHDALRALEARVMDNDNWDKLGAQ